MLVGWIVSRVSLEKLGHAFAALDWHLIAPLTVFYVVFTYLWDSICLAWLFSDGDPPMSYRRALRVRGTAYVVSIINYGAGQGVLAWLASRAQCISYLSSLMRCILYTYVDVILLLTLGLIGGLLSPRVGDLRIAQFCGITLSALIAATILAHHVPARLRETVKRNRWGAWLVDWQWNWRRTTTLAALRTVAFTFVIAFVYVGLTISHGQLSWRVLAGIIPLALICDGLPISFAGLGTRETVLVVLLQPSQPEAVIAFTLFWTVGTMIMRACIGLAHLWLLGVPASKTDNI